MTTKTRIFRAAKGTGRIYFSMRCDTAQDSSLSWPARGMLAYFLSLKDGWELTIKDLQQKCGRDKAYRILAELRKAKYLQHDRIQKSDGTFTWGDYQVHERPYTEKQEMDKELSEPFPEKPYTANTESSTHNSSKPKRTGEPQSEQPISDPDCAISASAESRAVISDKFPKGTISFDEMLDHLDLTQADIDAVEDDPVKDEKPFIKEWRERGYEVGQSAFWWYEEGNKFVPGEIIRFTAKFAIFKSVRIDTGEVVEKRIGPGRCSGDGSTEGWYTLDDLDLLERAVAVGSYGMTDEQTISGDRLKKIRGHLKYLRTQFQNGHMIDESELRAAYGWQKAQSISAPKRSDALADMVNGYREAKAPAQQPNTPDPVEEADPKCPRCNGGGRLKLFNSGKLIDCPCRGKQS